MDLTDLGWTEELEKEFAPLAKRGWVPARLIRDNKITYGALYQDDEGDLDEEEVLMSGKVYHDAETDAELPAVGDWVALEFGSDEEETMIRHRLARRTCFSRKVPGKSSEEQVIAANVDVVVVVTDAGADFNLRRMERYFLLIERSGSKPVVLVNKSDLYEDDQNREAVEAIADLAPEADVFLTSAVESGGLEVIRRYLEKGRTVTIVGSSGVGKSTLINQLLGDDFQWTSEVNELTGKGRHTTTARELIVLPEGGILVDNPGMREIQMWTDEQTLRDSFADIKALAAECKFSDCKHGSDAGCAIRAAAERGDLDEGRFESYLRLDEEIEHLRKRRKRRQMNVERRAKRNHKVKARNLSDRIDYEKDLNPHRTR